MADVRPNPRRCSWPCTNCTHSRRGHAYRQGYFQPRTSRSGYIIVRRVACDSQPRRLPRKYSRTRITAKLAGSREHAKRLLRSVIAPPHNPSHSPRPQESAESRPRTQSWGGPEPEEQGIRPHTAEGIHRPIMRGSIGGPVSGMVHRPSLSENVRLGSEASVRPSAAPSTPLPGVDAGQKPVASGTGVSVSLNLAEPVLFLQGFEQHDMANGNTAMLRGTLHLRVTKAAKIKAVTLKFKGRATTKWPEGESDFRIVALVQY